MLYDIQEIAMGVNAPREHQRVIGQLFFVLAKLYFEGKINLEPFVETMLDDTKSSAVPDVSLYDNEAEQTKIIIEVCKTNGEADDFEKLKNLIEYRKYGIEEGFVYNYKKKSWLKYSKGKDISYSNTSWSDVLSFDLADALESLENV